MAKYLLSYRPGYAPNKEWIYSNAGIGLLGIALENATQMQINELYIRHIFNPLRMLPIGLTVPEKFRPYIAQGYRTNGKPAPEVDCGLFPAAGCVKMTSNDMQKFLGAAIGLPNTPERVLYPMLMTELPYVKLAGLDQGLGWDIVPVNTSITTDLTNKYVQDTINRPIYNPRSLIYKTGGTSGFRAYMGVIPYKKAGIAIFTNKFVATAEIENTAKTILYKLNRV